MGDAPEQVHQISADEMEAAADEIWALGERVISPSTQTLLRQAASKLRWQAQWERKHPSLQEAGPRRAANGYGG